MGKNPQLAKFRRLQLGELHRVTSAVDEAVYRTARQIIEEIQASGQIAIRKYAERFDSLSPTQPLMIEAAELNQCLDQIDQETAELLERTKQRIERFAESQLECLTDLDIEIPGGRAGHRWFPLRVAGCYAPGGRYPLPSSVLMTAVTARVAGVQHVIVASPRPNAVTMAAAAIAKADQLLCLGGAQAIAAFAFGIQGHLPPCDIIVGPGNRYVTAAKSIVSRFTRIDMLAGPSELVVATAGDTDPAVVAADLLAQAEHDPDARPILITSDVEFPYAVEEELNRQLESLPTAETAIQAISSGGYSIAKDFNEVLELCRIVAPEHLSIQGNEFEQAAARFDMGAALFIGSNTAEVFGDYGAGPNHTLPTGGTARSQSGLSVFNFLRCQTFLDLDSCANDLIADAAALGRLEGLEAHARSAELR